MRTILTCGLCAQKLPVQPIVDQNLSFCCTGCQAVYAILASRQQLDNYEEHPVFKQALKSGLISNPELLEQLRNSKASLNCGKVEKFHLEVTEMWCPSCAEIIRLILLQEKGVQDCYIDYATDLGLIEFFPQVISKQELLKKIANLGYKPALLQDSQGPQVSKELKMRFIIAAFCALNVMMFAYPLYATHFHFEDEAIGSLFAWISCLVSLPVITYSAWPILRRALNGWRVGIWGMETLVILGVAAAWVLSMAEILTGGTKVYFDSMTVVIAFVLLGRTLKPKPNFLPKTPYFV